MVAPILVPVVGQLIDTVAKVADDLITTDEERSKLDLEYFEAETKRLISQTDINKEEAKSSNVFVSGARPAIMWVCAAAFAYVAVLEPVFRFLASVVFGYNGAFPVIDTDLTMQVLFGILGLGIFRTAEKFKGVASK